MYEGPSEGTGYPPVHGEGWLQHRAGTQHPQHEHHGHHEYSLILLIRVSHPGDLRF